MARGGVPSNAPAGAARSSGTTPSGTRSFAGSGGAESRRSASRRSRIGAAGTRRASWSGPTWT
eukprot:11180931-Lingulodinium_polyedra.AAC.1